LVKTNFQSDLGIINFLFSSTPSYLPVRIKSHNSDPWSLVIRREKERIHYLGARFLGEMNSSLITWELLFYMWS
jgi:hypothetical protein